MDNFACSEMKKNLLVLIRPQQGHFLQVPISCVFMGIMQNNPLAIIKSEFLNCRYGVSELFRL